MRKISIILTALTLISGCASCGSNSSATSDTSSQILTSPTEESVETTTEDELIEVDPFENVDIIFNPSTPDYFLSQNSYPTHMCFDLNYENSESQFVFKEYSYNMILKEANTDSVVIDVIIPDEVADAVKEDKNIILKSLQKEYIVPLECVTNLMREDQLTDANIELIKNAIQVEIISGAERLGDTINTDFEVVSTYMSDIDPECDFITDYDFNAINKEGSINVCEVDGIDNGRYRGLYYYMILKNTDNEFFGVRANPLFYDNTCIIETNDYKIDILLYYNSHDEGHSTRLAFSSKESVISSFNGEDGEYSPDDFQIKEIK